MHPLHVLSELETRKSMLLDLWQEPRFMDEGRIERSIHPLILLLISLFWIWINRNSRNDAVICPLLPHFPFFKDEWDWGRRDRQAL